MIRSESRPAKLGIGDLASLALEVSKIPLFTLAYWTLAGINLTLRLGRAYGEPTTFHDIKFGMLPESDKTLLPKVEIGITELPELDIDVKDLPKLEIGITELPKLEVGVTELPELDIGITELPKLEVGITELPKINVALDPLEIKLTEFPSIRVHLPVNLRFGLCLLGREIAGLRVCGEAQVITEPYVPNPCEKCH